jgi:hypothetical protein
MYYYYLIMFLNNEMGGGCSSDEGGERRVQGFGGGNLKVRDNWGDSGVDGTIILKWIFKKWDVGDWTGLSWFRIETGGWHM